MKGLGGGQKDDGELVVEEHAMYSIEKNLGLWQWGMRQQGRQFERLLNFKPLKILFFGWNLLTLLSLMLIVSLLKPKES